MVQPLRARSAAALVLLGAAAVSARAHAEPLPSSCRPGLVLGVADDDARDVVASVCSAARTRGTTGLVRVSVLGTDGRVRVAVARTTDATGAEQTAHVDAPSIAGAVKAAPALLDVVDARTVAAAPPPAPPPVAPVAPVAPAPPPASEPAPDPAPSERPPEPDAPPLQTKAGPPAAMVGVHGGATFLSNGASAAGGGASIGVDHKSAQGFIDFLYARAPLGEAAIDDLRLTMGARLKLSQSSVVPLVGGGWSYSDHEARSGTRTRKGSGIGVFGEAGVLVPIEHHQIVGLARLDLGLYGDAETELVPSGAYAYRRSTSGPFTPTYALIAGYGYVFR